MRPIFILGVPMSRRSTTLACTAAPARFTRWATRMKKDSPGWSSRTVSESNLCGVLVTRRRWYSAQAGKPNCRAGEAAEHRDSENDTFHHGALLLKDQHAKLNMVRERRHAHEVGCALGPASSEARHRHKGGGRATRCPDLAGRHVPILALWRPARTANVRSDRWTWRIEVPEGTAQTTDIFEIMHTMRAMRRLKPDPVPDELIRKILLAGQAAANGGNTQRWRFLVLKNHPGKKVVQGYYKKLFDEVVGPRYRNSAPPPGSDQPKQLRQMAANQYLTDHYHEAPVWIVACLEGDNPGYSSGASIYPAVENMLLAARALGLGSTLTTRHIGYAKECDEAMGIPPNYHSYAILPIGYPMGRFGPVGRGPLSEVVYLDGWGKPYPEI